MRIGLSLALPEPKYNVLAQNVQALFADGSQGWWYDDNDTTTLFQDSAGTTPVTAVEQSVGLQLDKSKGGVGTNGTRRVNLLTYTEQFDNAVWTKVAATVTANATTAPDGTSTADLLVETAATNNHRVSQGLGTLQAQTLTVSIRHKAGVGTRNLDFAIVGGASFVATVFSTTTGAVLANNDSAGSIFSGKQNSVSGPDAYGFYTSTITVNLLSAQTVTAIFGLADGTNNNYLGNGTSGIYIWGADLRLAADANVSPTYQRITDTWYNTLPGNHRYQTTSGSRPVWSKRVNLLVNTGFTGAVAGNPGTAPASWSFVLSTGSISNVSSDRLTFTASGTRIVLVQALTYTANTTYRSTFVVHENSGISASQLFSWNQSISGAVETFFANGVSQTVSTYIPAPGDVLSYRLAIGATSGNSAIRLGLGCSAIATGQVTISQPDIRPLNQATGLLPLYQRVNTSTDYDTNGFPGYLKADGVDDFLQTNSIDFTATDKITLCAGVRKLSDASYPLVVEFSANANSNNGAVNIIASGAASGSAGWSYISRGTASAQAQVGSGYASPITNVVTGVGEISTDTALLRVNGTQVATSATDQGTGNFGNYPAYFFRRGGTTLPFNGYEYGNIAVGKLLTADQLTALETYVNGATRAY